MGKTSINKKGKGIGAERELLHQFWQNDWVCVRVAGSGSQQYPAPDVLASRGDRKIVMEVKVVESNRKYFKNQEIKDLDFFAEKFGAESWIGVKFPESQWYFLPTLTLEETKGGNFVVDLIDMKKGKGFTFEEMINEN